MTVRKGTHGYRSMNKVSDKVNYMYGGIERLFRDKVNYMYGSIERLFHASSSIVSLMWQS